MQPETPLYPYGDPANNLIGERWEVSVAETPSRYLITYVCPLCHTEWSTNVDLAETSCELYCNLDGNEALYSFRAPTV